MRQSCRLFAPWRFRSPFRSSRRRPRRSQRKDLDRPAPEIEAYLKTAEVVGMEELKVGVTKPQRAKLAPGGPVEAIAWKACRRGDTRGSGRATSPRLPPTSWTSCSASDMVPPTVEKRVKGDAGAAVMWCIADQELQGARRRADAPPPAHLAAWNRQLAKAKMFDNLIGNMDPNLGNWLVDPAWNLILIDHTRAFTTDKESGPQEDGPHRRRAVGQDEGSRRNEPDGGARSVARSNRHQGILERRDKMQEVVDKLQSGKGQ